MCLAAKKLRVNIDNFISLIIMQVDEQREPIRLNTNKTNPIERQSLSQRASLFFFSRLSPNISFIIRVVDISHLCTNKVQ
jgi:hypothetical protein